MGQSLTGYEAVTDRVGGSRRLGMSHSLTGYEAVADWV